MASPVSDIGKKCNNKVQENDFCYTHNTKGKGEAYRRHQAYCYKIYAKLWLVNAIPVDIDCIKNIKLLQLQFEGTRVIRPPKDDAVFVKDRYEDEQGIVFIQIYNFTLRRNIQTVLRVDDQKDVRSIIYYYHQKHIYISFKESNLRPFKPKSNIVTFNELQPISCFLDQVLI